MTNEGLWKAPCGRGGEGLIILTRRYNGTQDRISNRWKNRPLKGVKVSRAHFRKKEDFFLNAGWFVEQRTKKNGFLHLNRATSRSSVCHLSTGKGRICPVGGPIAHPPSALVAVS